MARSAREEILGKVRSALADSQRSRWQDIAREYRTERPEPDLVELFCERVADYQATVQRVGTEQLPDALVAAVRSAGAGPSAGAGRLLTPRGLPQLWCSALEAEFELVSSGLGVDELDRVRGVVTTAAVGIASTGSIVLDHRGGQGRRADTLVPDLHVCVVREDQIVDDVPAAVARLDPGQPLTFISGPSATSDIELNRVEGVHGPRTLTVLVVPAAAESTVASESTVDGRAEPEDTDDQET